MAEEHGLQVKTAEMGHGLVRFHATQATRMGQIETHAEWPLLAQIPVRMRVALPRAHFKVKDLLGLRAGNVVESEAMSGEDVPLYCGHVQLGWAEFEVVGECLAVRMTRLA